MGCFSVVPHDPLAETHGILAILSESSVMDYPVVLDVLRNKRVYGYGAPPVAHAQQQAMLM